ncbi:hypothetical protein D9758_007943 [Tetrapyrgos nigripes]|uniref:Major facilitator superfamily (MFS) profile domain-containing protein n=1 Tax=Tetrapyrgos nigripes TaxID=182062 RepID=A0A8H5FY31_9AGAR|nr:hypothetical protein D9758_007943 [Tetrapyrgos nigripes]
MRAYTFVVGLFAGLGSFLFGYDTGIITTSIAHESFKAYMGHPNDAMTGAIVSTYIAGEAIGAITQILLGDRLGRKRFMQLLCFVATVGTVIQTAAVNYGMFLVGRILTGIAVGGLVGTVPIYNSEIAPSESRGIIGGLSGYMIGIGGFLANWVGFACGYASDSSSFQWRFPLALQIPPGIILYIGLQWMLPESPRWLIRHRRDEEAKKSFKQIRGDLSEDAVHTEFEEMKEQILLEKETEVSSFKEAWTRYRKRVLIAVAVQTMTSLTGVNVINYYQTTLYTQLGITGHTVLLMAGIYATVGVIINVFSLRLLDTFGRVRLLGYGSLGLCFDLIYSALMARYFADSDNEVGKGFAVLGIYLFTAIYYLGINSTTWLYGVEILPIFLRSKVTGLASLSHFVWNIALTEAGPSAFANIGENYYWTVGSYDTGIITTSIAHETFKAYMGHPNDAMTGAIVSTYIAGEAIGAVVQMILGDKLGRKRFMQLMCLIVTVGTVIQTAAQNYGMSSLSLVSLYQLTRPCLTSSRHVCGWADFDRSCCVGAVLREADKRMNRRADSVIGLYCSGGLIGTVPIYQSEIAPPETRGFIGGLSGWMVGLANWIGYACAFAPSTTSFQWRFPLALQIPPGVILFFGLQFLLPESPRWLIRHHRDEEARMTFSKIRGDLSGEVHIEFHEMKEQILYEKETEVSSLKEAWTKYRKRFVIAIAVQTMTSATGINVINYYQTTLYQQMGIMGNQIFLLAACYGTVGLTMTSISLRLLDTLGRAKLLVCGSAGLCIVLVYSALMARFFANSDNRIGKGFGILGIYVYTAIYYLTINCTTWLYGVEILPMSLRSRITGLSALSHFVLNVGLTEAGPSAFANIHENFYCQSFHLCYTPLRRLQKTDHAGKPDVFVATMFVTAVGIYFHFPETKGRSLEMIAKEFGDRVVVEPLTEADAITASGNKDDVEEERVEYASA